MGKKAYKEREKRNKGRVEKLWAQELTEIDKVGSIKK